MNWQKTANSYFKNSMNDDSRLWLKDAVDLSCKKLLSEMTRDEILQVALDPKLHCFSCARLVRTQIWQTLARVMAGKVKLPGHNVRSFWYGFVDPLFRQFQLYPKAAVADPAVRAYAQQLIEDFPYERYRVEELVDNPEVTKNYTQDMSEDCIRDFVLAKVFKYQGPFRFEDPSAGKKLVGTHNASLLFVVEKEGLWGTAQDYYYEYGITVMASKGNPSWVAIEYLTDQIRAKGIKNIRLATLVDYDPGGYGIADDYANKLEVSGFKIKTNTMITSLNFFPKVIQETSADDYSHCKTKGKQKLADQWFAKTNGVHGRKAGIHIDLADFKLIDKSVKRWFNANSSKGRVEDY